MSIFEWCFCFRKLNIEHLVLTLRVLHTFLQVITRWIKISSINRFAVSVKKYLYYFIKKLKNKNNIMNKKEKKELLVIQILNHKKGHIFMKSHVSWLQNVVGKCTYERENMRRHIQISLKLSKIMMNPEVQGNKLCQLIGRT